MHYTQGELMAAIQRLEEARRNGLRCSSPRKDAQGATSWEGGRGEQISYGEHGHAFLGIEPETGEIKCQACEGRLDATVRQENRS